jgi:hypothetical protein
MLNARRPAWSPSILRGKWRRHNRVIGFWAWAAIVGAAGCASAGGGSVGAVDLAPPQPAHGDDLAIAWPFTLVHGGDTETLADFHLRIEQGGTLVAVRPDRENPDTGARFRWRGEMRDGAAYWIGDPLVPGDGVTLTILVRPDRRDPASGRPLAYDGWDLAGGSNLRDLELAEAARSIAAVGHLPSAGPAFPVSPGRREGADKGNPAVLRREVDRQRSARSHRTGGSAVRGMGRIALAVARRAQTSRLHLFGRCAASAIEDRDAHVRSHRPRVAPNAGLAIGSGPDVVPIQTRQRVTHRGQRAYGDGRGPVPIVSSWRRSGLEISS